MSNAPFSKPIPFQGGCDTYRSIESLTSGAFSMVQNVREMHPGMRKRKGQAKLHTVADGTNKVVTLFNFSKGLRVERHLFAQMSDGDILEAAALPPTVTTGAFGAEVFSGAASQIPASWSACNDILIHSNGSNQHQLYAGTDSMILQCNTYSTADVMPLIPEAGSDYTEQLIDGDSTTYATFTGIGANTSTDCVMICTPIVANRLGLTVLTGNGLTSAVTVQYWNGSWTAVQLQVDGTASSGHTIGQTGYITWEQPTDAIPNYMYGLSGFWLKLSFSAALSETKVSSLTFGSTFQPLQNVWDGSMVQAVESRYYKASEGSYYTYATTAIDISSMTTSDYVYFNSPDPLLAFYQDTTSAPSTVSGVTISEVATWTGNGFVAVTALVDGTAGFTKSGWVTFDKTAGIQKLQFQGANYYSYWYRVKVSGTIGDNTQVSIYGMPYFSMNEFGAVGRCSIAWKNRAVYASSTDQFLYVAAANAPMTLNGDDYAILEPGDGRSNRVCCMRQFKNEMMVWQEEKGTQGGCLTLFEGYTPATFGRLVLSTKIGCMNAKSAVVVEGIKIKQGTSVSAGDVYVTATGVIFLSRYGIYRTEGLHCENISGSIRNYFDPTSADCIRAGYESEMWLDFDSTYRVVRVGLVTGSTATTCNTFLVLDIEEWTWGFDVLGQELSCHAEIEAGSGAIPVLQIGGGTDDGTVYQLNTGVNDAGTAIQAKAQMELDGEGGILNLREIILRHSGTCTVTPIQDGTTQVPMVLAT